MTNTYVFIDEGNPGDEPVAVGPYATEAEAREYGRPIMALMTPEAFADYSTLTAEDERPTEYCEYCNGTGSSSDKGESWETCDDCDGLGRVFTVREEAK